MMEGESKLVFKRTLIKALTGTVPSKWIFRISYNITLLTIIKINEYHQETIVRHSKITGNT